MAITPGGRVGDATPLGKPGGPRKLTDYTREVAHALMRDHGYPRSIAIAIARSQISKWAKGGGKVRPQVRAGAAKSDIEQHVLDHVPTGKRRRSDHSNGGNEMAKTIDLGRDGAKRANVEVGYNGAKCRLK